MNDEMNTEVIESNNNGYKPKQLSPYWLWKGGISEKLLECFLDEIEEVPFEKGKTFSSLIHGYEKNPDVRNSDVMFFDAIHWFSGVLFNYAVSSNIQAEWNIEITVPQTLQVAQYGPSQHYSWHSDCNMFIEEPIIRKLTAICLLSDRTEFEGGDLELADFGPVELNKGDVIVFPSILQHRVTPVTSGVRKSSTLWILGNRRW